MTDRRHSAYDAALDVLRRLRAGGFQALFAGGCVRDRLLGRAPKDYDVATNATPERVVQLFPSSRQVGARFGVILVRRFGFDVEVATFRSDGEYSDGRRPECVTFGTDREDALRRDFTINGLFLDPADERIIDYVGGRADAAARVLRTIGDPEQRFQEDHLRMLRAVRFSAELNFEIAAETFAAMTRLAGRLVTISPERIWMELSRILASPTRARGWDLLVASNLRGYLSPDWPVDAEGDDRAARRLDALPKLERKPTLGLAATVVDLAPYGVPDLCRSLRLSNAETDAVIWLTRSLPVARDADRLELADIKTLMHSAHWTQLLELLFADLATRNAGREPFDILRERAGSIAPDAVAPPPLLTGDDLAAAGFQPGPAMGETLRALTRAHLNDEIRTREEAWEWIQRRRSDGAS